MNGFEQDNPKGRYDYLQNQFRKQAQKAIDLTLKRLNSKYDADGFNVMHLTAVSKTRIAMQQMGLLTESGQITKVSPQEYQMIYEIYFETYLERERRGSNNQTIPTIGQSFGVDSLDY